MTINLTVPNLSDLKPRIAVFGVGGAGGNAVNNMIESRLEGVEFVVANTDAQALMQNAAQRRIQMGTALTQGLGAGSQPQIGAAAAEEALPEILDHLAGAHMAFITAGMGGGTGTGAAPVIARAAKEQGILTVGVVTKPFQFEGVRRQQTAERGIEQLAKHVDTLIVIPNQNLFRVANEKTTFAAAFAMADQVLYSGVASITELMTKEGLINLDFADVRAIMSEMGRAMMGTGEASGDKRAIEAAEAAISNPLLDDVSMRGARGLLISITGGPDLTLYEVDEAATRIREEVDPEANIILGATFDESLEGIMRVSVVATGLAAEALKGGKPAPVEEEAEKPSVFGWTGKQAAAPKKPIAPVAPAPVAAAPAPVVPARVPAPAPQPAPAPVHARHEEEVAEAAPPLPAAVIPERSPAPAATRVRMPAIDDFPPQVKKQIEAQQTRIETIANQAEKKKPGLFQRLASVGLGRKDDPPAAPAQREPSIAMQAAPQRPAMQPRAHAPAPQAHHHEQHLDDDQLEIPAFLRRQAN
ncbi:cell division protein FtsZ [Aestuariivirga litoralis]|uniref:Cell division protein FtsZ n=1 Tax=Aestuariivirga litoralis TaxID=2650924 RepID=A0A2W2BII4_9HYPH|nr:cell division protein FtsZ [Aestuariivirga litoralis]PZF75989.1 cell division protein FtsZ [Aestuariivirga litoralis]